MVGEGARAHSADMLLDMRELEEQTHILELLLARMLEYRRRFPESSCVVFLVRAREIVQSHISPEDSQNQKSTAPSNACSGISDADKPPTRRRLGTGREIVPQSKMLSPVSLFKSYILAICYRQLEHVRTVANCSNSLQVWRSKSKLNHWPSWFLSAFLPPRIRLIDFSSRSSTCNRAFSARNR